MGDDGGRGVHAGAALFRGHGDAEQAELAEAAEQRRVELLLAVERFGLAPERESLLYLHGRYRRVHVGG
jgi:hypothetical protein